MKRIFTILLAATGILASASAARQFITFTPADGVLPLRGAPAALDQREHSCVKRAFDNLLRDIETVTGQRPAAMESDSPQQHSPSPAIIVGTVGSNAQIDQWVKQGVLADLKGRTEKYIIKTIGEQLVIAGSDKRGTVYGIYELTQQMGVSPWYWWADVPVEHHDNVYAVRGEYTDGEPAVRYRGLFLNDEAPCLTSWVHNTWGTRNGDHRFYEKVFELILRLKGNFLWPAMWMWAFYADDPLNSKTADEMGVIIGTSHHEPMARNHQEWARHRKDYGQWNYQTNQATIDRFFREGIERMKGTDDIVTIGMRGDGDEAMSEEADTKLLERIVSNQRRIIKEVTKRPAKETPQVWALYKEVLDYYDKGMRVPDDVIMLLCDDNWGNVRRVPSAKERQHPGGWGLYYHVDYVGAPRNSKWLNVTPAQGMWEQLSLAYDYGIDRLWILNVGDLKPMEYPIQLFMDMAWNPRLTASAGDATPVLDHTEAFCARQFGPALAPEAARILNRLGVLNGRCTPEMLDARTYNVETGEWRTVADDYMRLEAEALRLFLEVPAARRDAYRQLILFPVQAMANLHQMYYAQAMNHHLAAAGDPDANLWAGKAREAFRRDSLLCAAYNNDISGGKWRGMMTQKHIGYTSWNDNFPADRMPELKTVGDTAPGGYTFAPRHGYIAIEAEHYYDAVPAAEASWTVLPDVGRTRSAITLMPRTAPVDGASISYRFTTDPQTDGNVAVHVVVKSTLDIFNKGGMAYTVSIDGQPESRVCFNDRLNEDKENVYSVFYPTVARRIVESVVKLPLPSGTDVHTLTLRPLDPAIVFEKVVIDLGGYTPQYLFGEESPHRKAGK